MTRRSLEAGGHSIFENLKREKLGSMHEHILDLPHREGRKSSHFQTAKVDKKGQDLSNPSDQE